MPPLVDALMEREPNAAGPPAIVGAPPLYWPAPESVAGFVVKWAVLLF